MSSGPDWFDGVPSDFSVDRIRVAMAAAVVFNFSLNCRILWPGT